MITEQLDELFHLAMEVVGVNSASDWVRAVEHLEYDQAKEVIDHRANQVRANWV